MQPAAMNSTSLIMEWFTICSTVPLTASPFSSPVRHCMAQPVRINPIWDMEEQARVRFKSMENTASTAPSTMVTAPGSKRTIPQTGSCRNMVTVTTRIPNTPVLVRMPDRSALAGAGAAGWALGSHTCSGYIPAFAPNPVSSSPPARYRGHVPPVMFRNCSRLSMESVPVPAAIMNMPNSAHRPPITAMARYVLAALPAASVSSCMTMTKEVRPIISKNRNSVNRLSDRNTPMAAPQVKREKRQYLPRLP